jgi:hypothetical protein
VDLPPNLDRPFLPLFLRRPKCRIIDLPFLVLCSLRVDPNCTANWQLFITENVNPSPAAEVLTPHGDGPKGTQLPVARRRATVAARLQIATGKIGVESDSDWLSRSSNKPTFPEKAPDDRLHGVLTRWGHSIETPRVHLPCTRGFLFAPTALAKALLTSSPSMARAPRPPRRLKPPRLTRMPNDLLPARIRLGHHPVVPALVKLGVGAQAASRW